MNVTRPLSGLLVLDFSQFLAGPSCALRLADLGARVIKIERPDGGDLCRTLKMSGLELDGDSTLFHTINRNKQSFTADLKDPGDRERVLRLVARADVLIQNFRPGVIERLGLGYGDVAKLNPRLVYGEVSGYGKDGPWRDRPGQDLLAQALSGIGWLTGDESQGPVPMGVSVADVLAGTHLTQGILACLVRRGVTGLGGHVEVSLLESILDLQFEVLTTHLNDGFQSPVRSSVRNAHAYLAAPYGFYAASDGYLALAMGSITRLGELLDCPALVSYQDPKEWFSKRDQIKSILVERLRTNTVAHWLGILQPAGIWCAEVLTWPELMKQEAFQLLRATQQVSRTNGATLTTTRCPIRIDGEVLTSPLASPSLGEHTDQIWEEFT